MAVAGPAQEMAAPAVRPPRTATLWAVGLAGWAAAGAAVALALTSDHVSEPGVQALLTDWAVIGYVLAGTIAWWRRPESRFGPLMIGVGFAFFLTSLTWSNAAVPYTIGIAFDLLPAALYLHVFLAFPSGRRGTAVRAGARGGGVLHRRAASSSSGSRSAASGPTTRSPSSASRMRRTRCSGSSSSC